MAKSLVRASFNRMSLFMSFVFSVNLVVMPLKGYFSEVLWADPTTFRPASSFPVTAPDFNRSASKRYVDQLQRLYNTNTLPKLQAYYYDSTHGVDVMRTVVSTAHCSRSSIQLLSGIMGIIYLAHDAKADLVDRLCRNESRDVARLWLVNFMGLPSFASAMWVSSGENDLGMATSSANVSTVYVLFVADIKTMPWREAKLVCRLLMCVWLAACVVLTHLRPLWQLKCNLERAAVVASHVHQTHHRRPVVRYSVVVGEPSGFVLTNPWICLVFVVDLIDSIVYISQATLRVCQATSWLRLVLGMMYFGRTVWLSYATLACVNLVLTRWKKRHWVAPANSTILAIAASVLGGGMTNIQGQWPLLVDQYTKLFMLGSRHDLTPGMPAQTMEIDSGVVIVIFTASMCCLPAMVTAAQAVWRRCTYALNTRKNTVASFPLLSGLGRVMGKRDSTLSRGTSVRELVQKGYDLRTRWYIWLCHGGILYDKDLVYHGGSVAVLLTRHPSFQLHCTLNQRGGDCFVCGIDDAGTIVDITRVTCISGQVDLQNVDDTAPTTGLAAGTLAVHCNANDRVPSVTLHRGMDESVWVA